VQEQSEKTAATLQSQFDQVAGGGLLPLTVVADNT
jgi:hypothetical protein